MERDDDLPVTELVADAARGDQQAWDALVERYTPLLVAVIARTGLTGASLEDVAQTVWLRLVEHLGDLREPRALPMWIVTTAKRESIRLGTADRRTDPQDPQGPTLTGLPDRGADPDAGLIGSERRLALLAGLATLSDRQRALVLLLIEDPPVPYAEISRRTGIPVGAIGPTRARALERLRQAPGLSALLEAPRPDLHEGDRRRRP